MEVRLPEFTEPFKVALCVVTLLAATVVGTGGSYEATVTVPSSLVLKDLTVPYAEP